jgi:hypothetical protein
MTAQQVRVLEQVDQLMTEHFDAYQMSAQISDIDVLKSGDGYAHQFSGPLATIMGMLDMHKMNLIKLYNSNGD